MNFEQVFYSQYAPLCNYITAIIKDHHAAEDMAQEIFIDIYKNNKLNKIKNIPCYLMRAARNKAIDYIRAQNKNHYMSIAGMEDQWQDQSSTDHGGTINENDIEPMFMYFMSLLPEKTRETFLMSRIDKMTYKEIADKKDVSIKTIENQMNAALKLLKELVSKTLNFFL